MGRRLNFPSLLQVQNRIISGSLKIPVNCDQPQAMVLGCPILIRIIKIEFLGFLCTDHFFVGIYRQRDKPYFWQNILNEFLKNIFLVVPEKDDTYGMQGKIGNVQVFGVIIQKPFAGLLFSLPQEDFKKHIGIHQVHYLHSIALCCNSTAVNLSLNSNNPSSQSNFERILLETDCPVTYQG